MIELMKLKFARTGFVCVFTAFFAFIAMMGEGLHVLPGMGHSCEQPLECSILSRTAAGHDDSFDCHSSADANFGRNLHKIDNAADCAVCKYFSLAKSCLSIDCAACDFITITERLVVCSPLLESSFVGTYQSRAPPPVMVHV
jgi:hypothetical protein